MRVSDFDRLYADHANALFSFLVYRLSDRSLAEDLLADTFERALRSHGRFDRRRGSEKSWLYSIALNLVRDHQRRKGVERRAFGRRDAGIEDAAADSGLERVEQRAQLAPALASLATAEREALALKFGADLTVPQIAKLLNEPMTTIEGRVYRGLRRLRAEMAGEISGLE